MLDIKVVYEETGEDCQLNPVWMVVDGPGFDWSDVIHIDIRAPFDRLTFDDLESERVAVSVPEAAYTRPTDKLHFVGVVLELVRVAAYASLSPQQKKQMNYQDFDLSSINRLVLRISDIEDTLQYELRQC